MTTPCSDGEVDSRPPELRPEMSSNPTRIHARRNIRDGWHTTSRAKSYEACLGAYGWTLLPNPLVSSLRSWFAQQGVDLTRQRSEQELLETGGPSPEELRAPLLDTDRPISLAVLQELLIERGQILTATHPILQRTSYRVQAARPPLKRPNPSAPVLDQQRRSRANGHLTFTGNAQ